MSNAALLLAKYDLGQLGTSSACALQAGRMSPIRSNIDNAYLVTKANLLSSDFGHIVGAAMLATAVAHSVHNISSYFEDYRPICHRQSDSQQQITQREQRARSIRTLKLQTEANVVRVLDFENPFPTEESVYSPPISRPPRVLKLKR
jgi:hypothetical protein